MDKLPYNIPEDSIFFNSQDINFKAPFGAVSCGENITFNIEIETSLNCNKVTLLIDGSKHYSINLEPLTTVIKENLKEYTVWSGVFKAPLLTHILFYYFEISSEKSFNKFFYGNNNLALGGIGQIYYENPMGYQITLFYKNSITPNWFKESVAYQIFPDRFNNGNRDGRVNNPKPNSFLYGSWSDNPMYIKNSKSHITRWDFFGGNLKGITDKISYFNDLNINLLYLNPIFEATSNHRYDTVNYHNIDPILGTYKDFTTMIKECKKRGIETILDGVFNHTGKNSIYFKEAIKSKDSAFYPWYRFKNYPTEYDCWWGIEDLPCVNELEPSFFKYIVEGKNSVLNHWMNSGIKGWRLDVADELPNYFIESLRYRCKEIDPESVIVGEVWEDASNKISYGQRREYFNGRQLDSVMNYPLRTYLLNFFNGSIDSKTLCQYMNSLKENYPRENYYSLFNLLSSHDVIRIKTSVAGIVQEYPINTQYFEKATERVLKSMSLIQFTLPGIPVIYYGDEVGVEGKKDPDNRRTYPWGKEDLNLLKWYKKISLLRKNSKVLKKGDIKFFSPHPDVFAYIRYFPNEKDFIGVLTNRSPNKSKIFNINLKEFIGQFSNNIATDIYRWNDPLIVPIDSSTNFPIKIPPLKTLLFSSKRV
ncbi:glycoside hydrolase family 13 protein [uncultured Cetobacterium sp.]|uniref:glycoside hydrolase family 13 protein n=1 Tax=uncultured Cetobacterium sp. TaxID=527638 RepID=UPI002632FCBC|nr:glycoside hydrolase family 13 protein [uncultured Cetobacterium sp.]